MKISVLIVIHEHNSQQIITNIESILVAHSACNKFHPFEIEIIIGNSNSNDINNELKNYFESKKINYINFKSNIFHSAGINNLSKVATGKYFFILNPDIVINPRIFINFILFISEKLNWAVIECRQIPFDHPKVYDEITKKTDWFSGAAFFISKEIFADLGGFDQILFPMYCNDVDLSIRLRERNLDIYYNPDMTVFHRKQISVNGDLHCSDFEIYDSHVARVLILYKYNQTKFFNLEINLMDDSDELKRKVKNEILARIERAKISPISFSADSKLHEFFKNPQFGSRRFE